MIISNNSHIFTKESSAKTKLLCSHGVRPKALQPTHLAGIKDVILFFTEKYFKVVDYLE